MATQTMRLETEPTKQRSIAGAILHHVPPEVRGYLLRNGLERILFTTEYKYPAHFTEKIQEYALNGGFVIVQNHTSNADIPAGGIVANTVTTLTNRVLPTDRKNGGFTEPFALSLPGGGQGEMSTFYKDVLSLINLLGIETVPTPTLNDILQGRISYQQFIENHRNSTKRMREAAIKERKGILLPAEATVQGGRINPETEQIYGMQILTPGAIRQALRTVATENEYGILIPVGISGGYKVLDSETNKITLPATIVGLGASFQSIMHVHVGEPIVYKKCDIRALDSESFDFEIGTTIAQMLKPLEQGAYANRETFVDAMKRYEAKRIEDEAKLATFHR